MKLAAVEQRFWRSVQKTDTCWIWTAGKSPQGYGKMRAWGKHARAHRVSWVIHKGAIPPGLCVLHRCDNPACVTPDHLFLGTSIDNNIDRDAKGRQARGATSGPRLHPERMARGAKHGAHTKPEARPRGERNGAAKLLPEQVTAARKDYATGRVRLADIAARLGVTTSTIDQIVLGRNWRHLAKPSLPAIRHTLGRPGEQSGNAKLTWSQAEEIRQRRAAGDTLVSIATQYGVGVSTVHRIEHGLSWRKLS